MVQRPSVHRRRPSSTMLKDLFLRNRWADQSQILCGASLGRGNDILFAASGYTLRLHYVPGDHGSHGSPKRSAPCDLVNFCLGTQVLLSIITFRHGLSRYPLQTVG